MSEQTARRLSWSIALISVVVVTIGLILSVLALVADGNRPTFSHQFFTPVLTLTYCLVGALVASRHPRNLIGWILCGTGFLSALNMLTAGYSLYDQLIMTGGSLPRADVAGWLSLWLWIPNTLLPVTFLLLLFPDGRLLSRRWLPIAWAAGLGTAVFSFSIAFDPTPAKELGATGPNRFGIPGAADILSALMVIATPLLLLGIFGSIASVVARYRRAQSVERAQVKWLAYAGVFVIVGNLVGSIPYAIWQDDPFVMEFSIVMTSVTLVGIVIATGIAILRYRLWDIDIVINRTLVYGSLTALVITFYVIVVGALSTLLQTEGGLPIALVGTGIVAVLFEPLRERLQHRVNRLMYGERDNPYAILRRLSQRLEVVVAPDLVLPTIVETVAEALKLPYAAITLKQGDQFGIVAEYSRPAAGAHTRDFSTEILTLVYQSETVGQIILARRTASEPFSDMDRQLLETIARQAGVAAYNVRLTHDLQRSREQLVSTREEERRRLRRDLHDGLGPVVAAMSFKLDAIHNLAESDAMTVRNLAAELKTQILGVLSDIRRIAYDLRPPSLDELGLVGALKEHIASCNQGQELQITLEAPEIRPTLPAAVEVAAYRIALEALTNVSRHAGARHCAVRLTLADDLFLEVTDDGHGLPITARAGVGLVSMRERAEELGGSYRAEALPQGGTGIRARLPLSSSFAAGGDSWTPSEF